MIERQIVASNVKELELQEYITKSLKNLGQSHIKLQKTPLGEKIIIHASRPGLIVGRKGQNIKKLTEELKEKFKLENPQIEINEVESPDLDAQIVAERIAGSLERFGTQRFKGVGHRVMADVMNAGAMGVEILISGKIPSTRAKRWRFYQGYLKKCGDIAIIGVRKAYAIANIKTGAVGIQVRIMPPDLKLPDNVVIQSELQEKIEEIKTSMKKEDKRDKKDKPASKEKPAKVLAKKTTKKASTKKPAAEEKKEEPKAKAEDKAEKTVPAESEKPVKQEKEEAEAKEKPEETEKTE